MKDRKLRLEDAINATKAAVEEGIVPGGGSTLAHLSLDLQEWAEDNLEGDELVGALIVEKAMTSPIKRIIENTGKSPAIITETVKNSEFSIGYNAAAGSLSWMMMEWTKHGKPSVLGIVTGMVAGLGTITPASGFVGPAGALVIGFSAGIICYYATQAIKQRFQIDDSLDVFPVHGVGGILGTLLAGVFASDALGVFSGQGYNEGMDMISQVSVQVIGIIATFTYTAVVTYVLLKLVDKLLVLRVDEEGEMRGLDLVEHDERGYDL